MRLIRLMRSVYRLMRMVPGGQSPGWTRQEAELLRQFLASPLGQRIKREIFVWIVRQTVTTVERGADNASYNIGYSAGFRDGIAALDTLVANGLLAEADGENEYD